MQRETFVELLTVHGKPMSFGDKTVDVLFGKADDLDVDVQLSGGERTLFSVRALRSAWGNKDPERDDYLVNPTSNTKHRIVHAPNDQVSDTRVYFLVG
ncbi:hypothetical protein MLD52_09125 [Puniceicoccaceae bacterium K14]|nr:hypothetical protein [Puniceicoccaceae bacterium K14]